MSAFQPYFFAQLQSRLEMLRKQGIHVIRLDMGSPDLPPSDAIIERLVQTAQQPDAHRYQPYGGPASFRQAVARYYDHRFGVSLDPNQEVLGLIGSKEGIFHLSQALLDPGDIALIPDPAYPTYARGALAAGAEIHDLRMRAESGFLPALDDIPESVLRRAKLLWLNYPNNPTSACATIEFFERVVRFARTHRVLIAHDAPYLEIGYDGYRAPSILQVPGAREVAIEFNSLSKTYNMPGWRLGMAVGHRDAIAHLHEYKVQVDSSHFGPLFAAGAEALTGDQSWLEGRNAVYQRRRDLLIQGLTNVGMAATPPKATLYVWARLPEGEGGIEFCERMLQEIGVSVTPGEIYGPGGEGYLRLSLCAPEEDINTAMDRMAFWNSPRGSYGG